MNSKTKKPITLATLPKATPLEVFEQGRNHMLIQGRKSMIVDNKGQVHCAYRDDDGNKCVAGCFISDEEMQERNIPNTSSWVELYRGDYVPSKHGPLIMQLQSIHDTYLPEYWKAKLNELRQRLDSGYFDEHSYIT